MIRGKGVASVLLLLLNAGDAFQSVPQPKLVVLDKLRRSSSHRPTSWYAVPAKGENDTGHIKNEATISEKSGVTTYKPLTLAQKAAQPIQLAVTIWLLLLLPAGIFSPHRRSFCGVHALGILPYQYLLLFGLGTLPRQWRFGKYSKVVEAKEGKRGTSTRDFILFQFCLFACHWTATRSFVMSYSIAQRSIFPASVVRGLDVLRWLAVALNCSAAWILGKAYDRVTKPEALVTSGPYSIVRHPIYTSYLLLFGSTMLSLGSLSAFAGLVLASLVFYSGRMKAEDDILRDAFPENWDEYAKNVPYRLFPWLL